MRVLVMDRCIRPRSLRLRKSERCLNGHFFHYHYFSFRPTINL